MSNIPYFSILMFCRTICSYVVRLIKHINEKMSRGSNKKTNKGCFHIAPEKNPCWSDFNGKRERFLHLRLPRMDTNKKVSPSKKSPRLWPWNFGRIKYERRNVKAKKNKPFYKVHIITWERRF